MRKVEQQMIAAIRNHRDAAIGNTTVTQTPRHAEVRLHGNLIAIVRRDYLHMTLAGWPSITTRSRLEAILRTWWPGVHVYQRNHLQYIDWYGQRIEIGPDDAVKITPDGVTT